MSSVSVIWTVGTSGSEKCCSAASSGPLSSGATLMGDAGVLFLRLFRRGFEFLVRIDPAHVFTFFFFLLVFRSTRFDGAAGSSGLAEELSGSCSGEDVAESASLGGVSDELALTGRERVGELLPRKGSRPMLVFFLGVLV